MHHAAFVLIGLVAPFAASSPSHNVPDRHDFTVALSGRDVAYNGQDRQLAGDPDGAGLVRLSLDPVGRRICYDFQVAHLATPLMGHIHRHRGQGSGPSVVTLFTGPGGELKDCITWTEKWFAEIVADPGTFYVSLSTTEFPDGAVQGQL